MAYPPSDLTQSIDALEKQLLATWKHERLFTRVSDATRYGPPFIFFEGPPTANGRPGIHHVFSRTLKDLICRFHTMLGQGVTRIAGWDTHGLPVEIEVEKAPRAMRPCRPTRSTSRSRSSAGRATRRASS